MFVVAEEELEIFDVEKQGGLGAAARPRVRVAPDGGLSEEVRAAACAQVTAARPGAPSDANAPNPGPQTGRTLSGHPQNGASIRPLEQRISTGNLSSPSWHRTRRMVKSGRLQNQSLATSALGALKKDNLKSTRQMIRDVFDELDSKPLPQLIC